ncbi:hypothetical protein BG004_003769 [Podila humilis]|nr:hypothetical protein BG004_003769 [Podila humilis]
MASPNTASTPTAQSQSADGETITHIQMAGLTVLMIKKKDQVIYKLPDNMSVQSLTQEQRDRLLVEINLLHHQQTTAQAIAATQAQTQQVQMAQGQGVRSIAPIRQANNSGHTNGTSTPTTPSSSYADQKTTRRYNKTGKYSKKKLLQQQQLEQQQDTKYRHSSSNITPSRGGLASATTTPTTTPTALPVSSASLTSAINQPEQVKLLTEIHQLHQALKLQETKTENLKEQEQTLLRTLALNSNINNAPSIEALKATQKHKARQLVQEAEQTMNLVKIQLQKKEASFRQLYPVASQQLLQLQQQQQQQKQLSGSTVTGLGSAIEAATTAATKTAGSRTPATGTPATPAMSMAGIAKTAPKTVEEQLQQQIAEHHDSVRNAMAEELRKAQQAVRHPDWKTPFQSLEDAIERLIPYHIYQYPDEDLEAHAKDFKARFENLLDEKAKFMDKRKRSLFERYNNIIKSSAKHPRTTNPSSALDILAARFCLEDERIEHDKVVEELKVVKQQADQMKQELDARQSLMLQQRRTEALMIEQQQKLILEQQRQEELSKLEQLQRQQQQEELQQSRMDEMQEHLQQQQERLREEQLQKELEKHHEMELERQMELKREQLARDLQKM